MDAFVGFLGLYCLAGLALTLLYLLCLGAFVFREMSVKMDIAGAPLLVFALILWPVFLWKAVSFLFNPPIETPKSGDSE